MRYSFAKSCLLALAAISTVFAQTDHFDAVTNPITPGTVIPAGKPFTITWEPSPAPLNGPINIILLQGSTNTTLQAGATIAPAIDASKGSFIWNVPTTTPFYLLYGFELQLVSDPKTIQFSTYFSISGLSGSSSGSSASTSSSATTSTTTASSTASTSTVVVSSISSTPGTSTTSTPLSSIATTTAMASTTSSTATTGSVSTATTSGAATHSSNAASAVVMGGSGLAGVIVLAFGLLI